MGEQIKKKRIEAGLTQEQVAIALGYHSASAISMWESGHRKPPADKLLDLAKLYGCTVDAILKEAN